MGNDICSGVSFKSICFDFFSTYIGISVIENSWNPHFKWFRCQNPLKTYLRHDNTLFKILLTKTLWFTGFYLYQVEYSALQSDTKLDRDFFEKNQPAAKTLFRETFETTKRFKLRPGSYAVIPTTFNPNKEGEFLLRIFSEKNGTIENFGSCTIS